MIYLVQWKIVSFTSQDPLYPATISLQDNWNSHKAQHRTWMYPSSKSICSKRTPLRRFKSIISRAVRRRMRSQRRAERECASRAAHRFYCARVRMRRCVPDGPAPRPPAPDGGATLERRRPATGHRSISNSTLLRRRKKRKWDAPVKMKYNVASSRGALKEAEARTYVRWCRTPVVELPEENGQKEGRWRRREMERDEERGIAIDGEDVMVERDRDRDRCRKRGIGIERDRDREWSG